jgi:molybdenum cofactor biosynthesis enzyme MoaA
VNYNQTTIKLEDTLSVCEHCYRHVVAIRFQRDNQIWLGKTCPNHGYVEHLVEPDAEFYLNYNYHRHALQSYFLEVTNRCNLKCPHCYQMPDADSLDPSIDYITSLIKAWPDDGYPVALVGAEPTVRKDLPELITAIQALPGKPRSIMILTNGVNLADVAYTKKFSNFKNVMWTVGLNHPDYQGHTVRRKQMEGIKNAIANGLRIKNVSYTLEDLTQMEYCLEEIQQFGNSICEQYRIRCGADIGRYPGSPKLFLSDLMKEVKAISKNKGWTYREDPKNGNRAHYPVIVNGLLIKIIQWPDATTLDLKEIQTEAIADILPGKPPSPLVHQVILRDGAINKRLMLWDTIPKEYIENYGAKRN